MAVAYLHPSQAPQRRLPAAIALRSRAPDDAEALFALFNEPSFLDQALMRDPFANVEELRRWMDGLSAERRYELVALEDRTAVGFGAIYVQGEHFSHCGTLVLGVRESSRGRGVGAVLLRALIATARNVGRLSKVQLTVVSDNAAAIRLYRRHGFHFEGLHRRFAFRNGRYLDAYSMATLIDDVAAPRAALSLVAAR